MKDRSLHRLLVVPMAIVALILGALLYRWSNQISEATSVRLADSLQMSMANWHLNLYRELSDVAGALRVDSENSGDLSLYARRFQEWRSASQYRDIVSGVYVIDIGAAPRFLGLDLQDYTFKPAGLPNALSPLPDQLQSAVSTTGENAAPTFPRGLSGWKFGSNPLVLVRSVEAAPGTWLAVHLDKTVIQSRILPDLAERYFMGVDGLDYLIAVVAGAREHEVIYSTDRGFGEQDVADADGRMDVFGDVTLNRFGSRLYVFHQLSESARLAGFPGSMGTQWFPLLNPDSGSGWQMIVRHRRGGPLGAFVAEMHRRDLVISFGALFLLIAMAVALVVASLRANRLAQLQMDFVTAISHELRSPLTIIGSAAENITHGVVTTREQIEQYGSVIGTQTRQLSRLVEDVLLFAATRENRHRYVLRTLEVSEIVDATLSTTNELIRAANFVVQREVEPNLPVVRGDLAAISQCLQNLITNALKYSGDSKWIGIRAFSAEDGGHGREIRIAISDRGAGIASHEMPHVFDPFFRGAAATDAQIHGTGLGLALARSIAEAMNGRLTVSSEPNVGTTFTLHLPVESSPVAASGAH